MVERTEYLKQLAALKGKPVIKMVTGIRRCGKSTLLELFRRDLAAAGIPPERMVSVNFEDMDNIALLDPLELHDYIKSRLVPGEITYLFFDEVQNGWRQRCAPLKHWHASWRRYRLLPMPIPRLSLR